MGGKWSNFAFAYFQHNPRDSFCQYSLPLGILCSHFANWWRRMVFLTKLVQSWHLNCFKLPFRVHSSWELVVEKMQQFYFYFSSCAWSIKGQEKDWQARADEAERDPHQPGGERGGFTGDAGHVGGAGQLGHGGELGHAGQLGHGGGLGRGT